MTTLATLPATLPRDFTIEASDHQVMLFDLTNGLRFEKSMNAFVDEMVKRGYDVAVWRDESTMTTKARCVLRA